jgi:hypothetical protein
MSVIYITEVQDGRTVDNSLPGALGDASLRWSASVGALFCFRVRRERPVSRSARASRMSALAASVSPPRLWVAGTPSTRLRVDARQHVPARAMVPLPKRSCTSALGLKASRTGPRCRSANWRMHSVSSVQANRRLLFTPPQARDNCHSPPS